MARRKRNSKSRITVLTPEQIAERREREEMAELEKKERRKTALRNPENWWMDIPRIPGETDEDFNLRLIEREREVRKLEGQGKAREAVKITFQALFECGTIRGHHAAAGDLCLEIVKRMEGQVDKPTRPDEYINGGLRNYEPIGDTQMTAILQWKRLSTYCGTPASNVIYRLCMAWIGGVQVEWGEVVRTEYNLPKDQNDSRDRRYLSAILVAALESASRHFENEKARLDKKDEAA